MIGQLPKRSPRSGGASELVTVELTQLRVDAVLRSPIFDAQPGRQHILLLSAGRTLTQVELAALQRRGVTRVLVHPSELERITMVPRAAGTLLPQQRLALRRAASPSAPTSHAVASKPVAPGFRLEADSFLQRVQPPSQLERSVQRGEEYARSYESNVQSTEQIFKEFVATGIVAPDRVLEISDQHLQEITQDLDEFLARGVQPIASDYPCRHSLQTAMLATSMGTVMGLRKDDLIELGFGCILHDAGMLLVPQHLHRVDQPLATSERLELQKHPIYAADLLNRCRQVPHGAKMVVYQMHERLNGTGYPRQRQGSQIHLLARIAAVADTYLAMVSPRSFRPGLQPYQAVEKLLFATRQGLFDPGAVRGLLHAVSLFPIGSLVQLNNGRHARVIRGNRDRFAQPVIEMVDLSNPQSPAELVDLSERTELQVVSTVSLPAGGTAVDAP